MSIWIVGASNTGKSTIAAELHLTTDLPVVEAGQFCRAICMPGVGRGTLNKTASMILQDDHRYFSMKIFGELYNKNAIVVGVRNPVDFIDSFNPKLDKVIFLSANDTTEKGFDTEGVNGIKSVVDFFLSVGILNSYQVLQMVANKEDKEWYDVSILCHF